MVKYSVSIGLAGLLTTSCAALSSVGHGLADAGDGSNRNAEVRQHGDLRLIASDSLNDSRTISRLAKDNRSKLYGIGMPTGLDKELLVDGGVIYTGGFTDLVYGSEQPDDLSVNFLAYAFVDEWKAVPIPDGVRNFAELESFVAHQAPPNSDGVFRLEADIDYARWFVVGGMGNGKPSHRQSFLRSRILGSISQRRVQAVGFYIPKRLGSATSPSAPMHVHFRTVDKGEPFVGHLDGEVSLRPGGTLYVPKSP